MKRVVCFGEALIDFLAEPSAAGARRTFVQHAGGAPANVAGAVARLGGRAAFVGMLGEDMFGDFLHESLDGAGVDTRHVARTAQAKTALAFVSLDTDGERSFSFYRPPSADLLFRPYHFASDAFDDLAGFHVCSNSLTEPGIAASTLEGMQRARAAGAFVSVDVNLRPGLWRSGVDPAPRIWSALRAADLVKLAVSELDFLAGDRTRENGVIDGLLQGSAQIVVITDGAGPVRWHTRRARGEIATFRVRAIDTTAAGDAFVGGLLYALARRGVDAAGLPTWCDDTVAVQHDLRLAAAAGALAVTRHGAFAAMPTLDAVHSLMAEAT